METSLFHLKSGQMAEIKKMPECLDSCRKLESLNIRIGKKIQKVTGQPFKGPVVIKIDNTNVSIGWRTATKIFVKEI